MDLKRRDCGRSVLAMVLLAVRVQSLLDSAIRHQMVMMIAMTPSLNASSLFLPI
jgi:hypothetical protein